jgi:dethiobiotin synthetase
MRILVTGTDRGVGKTWVACTLAHALRDVGKQVVAIKPVETGCTGQPSKDEDGMRLARATGQSHPAHAIVRLPERIAPVLADPSAGSEIDFDALLLKIERLSEAAEFALIEGTGGLLAPVTWEWNMADVARTLGASALVVAADRVGTINHTLLTLSALELAGIACIGVVLTTPEKLSPERSEEAATNATAIARLSGIERVLALGTLEDEKAAAAAIRPVLEWFSRVGAPA